MHWEDPMFERGYAKWRAYGQSKSANALLAVHLAGSGVPASGHSSSRGSAMRLMFSLPEDAFWRALSWKGYSNIYEPSHGSGAAQAAAGLPVVKSFRPFLSTPRT